MRKIIFTLFSLVFVLTSCSSDAPSVDNSDNSERHSATRTDDVADEESEVLFAKGADISWITEMENKGWKFYYTDGQEGDCMKILKDLGMDTFRLRVWVNPRNGYNSLSDVLKKARRASALGMHLMIDFHYSDTWADPSAQKVPADWDGLDIDGLVEKVAEHTSDVLNALKSENIDVRWVQIGNETGNGMLFPYGQADKNPKDYARLTTSGYDAVKSIYPDAKVIVHLQNGQNNSLFRWLFDILKKNGAKWDVIGMSLYPEKDDYAQYVEDCKKNMIDMISRYDKDVMLCEVGMGNSYVTQCQSFLNMCFSLRDAIPADRFVGLLYWEPQCYNSFNGYKKGAFTNSGRPSEALEAFKPLNSSVPTITVN